MRAAIEHSQGVQLVRPNDPRLALLWREDEAGFEQSMDAGDGPLIVVGAHASDQQLTWLARRFALPLARLRASRDAR